MTQIARVGYGAGDPADHLQGFHSFVRLRVGLGRPGEQEFALWLADCLVHGLPAKDPLAVGSKPSDAIACDLYLERPRLCLHECLPMGYRAHLKEQRPSPRQASASQDGGPTRRSRP